MEGAGEVLTVGAVGVVIALIVKKIESAALAYVIFSLKFRGLCFLMVFDIHSLFLHRDFMDWSVMHILKIYLLVKTFQQFG